MRNLFCSVLALFGLAATPVLAQEAEWPPNMPIHPDAATATLTPSSRVVNAESKFTVELNIKFKSSVHIPTTLLTGHYLEHYLNDEWATATEKTTEGVLVCAPDLELRRSVVVDMKDVVKDRKVEEPTNYTVRWSGIPGATAQLTLMPDYSGIDIADLDLAKTRVRLVTNFGDMVVGFRPDKAPKHVENFIKLSKDGFYDGTKFHRIIKGFMIQGGCPNTKKGASGMPGTGNPGYFVDAEFSPDLKHKRGILSMARSASPNSAGCQFFVMHGDAPGLDGKYSIFGQLEQGETTLDKICDVRVRPTARGEASDPVEPIHLHAAVLLPVFKNK